MTQADSGVCYVEYCVCSLTVLFEDGRDGVRVVQFGQAAGWIDGVVRREVQLHCGSDGLQRG